MNECDLSFIDECKLVYEGLQKGFSYDGCTSSPDFDFGSDCCGAHDYHYQQLGISRGEADRRLFKCIWPKGAGKPWPRKLAYRAFLAPPPSTI